MTCADALDRMLEADPAALSGRAGDDRALADHLRQCGRCRAVATALTVELAALDQGLGALATGSPGRAARGPSGGPDGVGAIGRRRRCGRWAWAPVATAAVLAAVLLFGRGERESGGSSLPESGLGEREALVAVTLPADRAGAVMSTGNRGITVVWLYERSER